MALHTWLIYLAAVIGLSLTPGPNGLLALTHGALYGHRKTLFTIAGGVTGFVVLVALSMLGIGALLQASSNALTVFKWAGGAYLVWMGIQLWRRGDWTVGPTGQAPQIGGPAMFRQGLLSALSNPKVLLFYGAFLPQFIEPQSPLLPQFVIMAATFSATEFLVEYLFARLAHVIRPKLERNGRRVNKIFGGLFAVMGVSLPLAH
jgi:homoserine/homoserine lactone efflux protein